MSDRRNRYTAVLFLTALIAGTIYLNLGSLPQPLEITEAQRTARVNGWNRAVKCSYGWAKDE